MNDLTLEEAMEELCSAEDFLEYFEIEFDQSVVHVNRLHILQRFHDYISKENMEAVEDDETAQREVYTRLLTKAYQDFVESDALTEKVFKVFHMHEPQQTFVSINDLIK